MQDDKLIEVEIVTPQKTLFSGKAESVSVPGKQSPFQILHNHASIVSALDPGAVKIVDAKGETKYFAISGGLAEVRSNKVSILSQLAEPSAAIDSKAAEAKIEELKPTVFTAKSDEERDKIQKEINYLQAKINLAGK